MNKKLRATGLAAVMVLGLTGCLAREMVAGIPTALVCGSTVALIVLLCLMTDDPGTAATFVRRLAKWWNRCR